MVDVLRDLRYGLRMLTRNPGFTTVAIVTLALGIGATTAIFSVIDAVLLHPLPYRDADRVTMIWEQQPERGWFRNVVSAANFVDWRKQNHVFTQMAAIDGQNFDVSGSGEPLEVVGEQVSADLFSVLGVEARFGRTFSPEEDHPGGPRVVVLSDGLWRRRFGGDPGLVGHEINVNRLPFTVIGIMPPGFYFPSWGDRAEIWIAGLDLSQPERTWHNYLAIARLKRGVGLEQAQSEMDAIARRLAQEYPDQKGWGVQLVKVHEQTVRDTRPALLVLLGAVGMVLLIACANIANLQLARVAGRQREIAVRSALGADRRRVLRQLLTESVLLAVGGGGGGLLLASWGVKLLVAVAPQGTPGLANAGVNPGVLAFTLALSVVTGIAFGLAPALGASRLDLNRSLKESARGSTESAGSHRLRSLLVGAEFALALILLAGAGLLIKTFIALNQVELGFDPHNVLTMRIALLGPRYALRTRQVEFFRDLIEKITSLPGVSSAAMIDGGGLPPEGGNGDGFMIAGRPTPPPSEMPDAVYRVISPDYFRAMRVPLVRGRYFTEADNNDARRVAIINEKLARDFWPGGDPLGSALQFPGVERIAPGPPGVQAKLLVPFTIVGVVGNVKNRGLQAGAEDEVYIPYSQTPSYYVPRTLVVRTSIDPALVSSAVRRQAGLLDEDQPVEDVQTMDEVVAQAQAGHRFPMILLGLFAGLAAVLAGVGIYGVMSYSVSQRVQEIGIRMALGAAERDVLISVIGDGLRRAFTGIIVGLAGGLVVTRSMSTLLYGVRPGDPLTFAAVAAGLAAVGVLASYIPARRATRIDPIGALRCE